MLSAEITYSYYKDGHRWIIGQDTILTGRWKIGSCGRDLYFEFIEHHHFLFFKWKKTIWIDSDCIYIEEIFSCQNNEKGE